MQPDFYYRVRKHLKKKPDNDSRTASIVGLVPGLTYTFTVTSAFKEIESAGAVLTCKIL